MMILDAVGVRVKSVTKGGGPGKSQCFKVKGQSWASAKRIETPLSEKMMDARESL